MNTLDVVLITRNQAWNVARLIESVLAGTGAHPSAQIVLVDSASSDGTPDLARAYPVDVLRLQPGQRLNAAIGRNIGLGHTRGAYVLFLDGDMALIPGWLERALDVLKRRPKVGAVTGKLIERPIPDTAEAWAGGFWPGTIDGEKTVRHGGGAALYRRAALRQVGPFNPFVYSDEEPELCLRLRHAGYTIVQLDQPVAYHLTSPSLKIATLWGRRQRKLYLGFGQNLRYHARDSLFWLYLLERGYGVPPLLLVVAGLACAGLSIRSRRPGWIALWLSGVAAILAAYLARKRSAYAVAHALLQKLLIAEGTVRGLFLSTPDPTSHHPQFEIVQRVTANETHSAEVPYAAAR